jgi:VPDSG-CTERM motif
VEFRDASSRSRGALEGVQVSHCRQRLRSVRIVYGFFLLHEGVTPLFRGVQNPHMKLFANNTIFYCENLARPMHGDFLKTVGQIMKTKLIKNISIWAVGIIGFSGINTGLKAVPITVIDLSGGPPASGMANGAQFFAADPRPTGTGVIDPFLREQNNGSEQGINTSIPMPPFDDKPGPFTHDLLVSQLMPTMFMGTSYYMFSLDANQEHNGPISLINFELFVTTGAPISTAAGLMSLVSSGTPSFNMNGGGSQFRVDITSQTGSGSGDMFVLVPVSDIGTSGNLYLYAQFGADANGNGFPSDDGFEEWSASEGTPTNGGVPDGGSTVLMLGGALCLFGLINRKLRSQVQCRTSVPS